ncbi:RsmB/NOP family class I SAM-dependent RNA methyltransferase [Alkalicaulis satelles]|uniref:RsmB/NOP family class I SAM-dependent RNA methyltransferase n=1 Tax=Alkalicaulis satelles TaxID=2609175 RepID=A0A5M6ZJZ9_9PROT|nr:RsmB/NOP family class I SAM-dependent RNA methyltransferase [Alkalicaulis satelles]KAA5805129.1 RsmB/NOP family class I SAM-dependent RNA methyltransferase [Alkalicaulis satelles]
MRDAGRIAAAIEVLDMVLNRHQPVKEAVRDWGKANRYAGSGDRAWISGLVLDSLRRKASVSHLMGDDAPRALALGTLAHEWETGPDAVAAIFEGDEHAPEPLTDAERAGMTSALTEDAPLHARAEIPDWLAASFERGFGADAAAEGAAMASRAPVDLRINTLKSDPEKALAAVRAKLNADPSALVTTAIRIAAADPRAKAPPADAIPAYGKGWVEVQDLGSQIAALAAAPSQGLQVLDFCAGAGGKTLALSALMNNTGQLYAWDYDWRRLRAIWPRLERAGVRNVQVRTGKEAEALGDLAGKMDVVFIDAPCTGSGTWRRRPDTKWRLKDKALATRITQQDEVLAKAAKYVKPGGRMVYVTCSVLPEENGDRVSAFLAANAGFRAVPVMDALNASAQLTEDGALLLAACEGEHGALQLTPARTGTDGFYVCVMERAA